MRTGCIVAIVVAIVLAICCALTVLVGVLFFANVQVSDTQIGFPRQFDAVSVEEVEQAVFPVEGPATLDLVNEFGDIEITAAQGDSQQIQVTITRTAWGSTQEQAQQDLDAINVDTVLEGNTLTIRVDMPEADDGGQVDTVDFSIIVPRETTVSASNRLGEISLSGTQGAAQLDSDFGSITVSDLAGELNAQSRNGSITAENIQAGEGSIDLETDFGSVSLEQATAQAVSALSRNGEVRLQGVETAGSVNLNSDFGGLHFEDGRALNLQADTQNGEITLREITVDEQIRADSNFGRIELVQASAPSYSITAANGEVNMDGAQGQVMVETQTGSISIQGGDEANLSLSSRSGSISYRGSLGEGPHTLETEFGGIVLTFPADAAFTVDLQTDFGSIESEFEVAGAQEPIEDRLLGDVNGGGPLVNATTNNGSIRLEIAN